MKVFFDRITNLLTVGKELERKLRGKKMTVISISIGNNLGEIFWCPFSKTANYLEMEYLGNMHAFSGKKKEWNLERFINKIS